MSPRGGSGRRPRAGRGAADGRGRTHAGTEEVERVTMRGKLPARGLIAALALWLLAWAATGSAVAQERVDQRRATGPEPYVRVMVLAGSVRVTGWDRDTIGVSGTVSDPRLFYFSAGEGSAKLGVWEEGPGVAEPVSASLEVRVPARATVWVKTESADILVSGVAGAVDAYSVTGGIRVEGEPRHVYAESMGGPLELLASAITVRAKTAGGSIAFRGTAQEVTLTTVAGNIVVAAPPLERGRFETVVGDIRFQGAVRKGGSLGFQTHSGQVEVEIPRDQGADVSVTSVDGEVRLEGIPTRLRGVHRDLRGRELAFLTGAGGAALSVRTFNGSIVVRAK